MAEEEQKPQESGLGKSANFNRESERAASQAETARLVALASQTQTAIQQSLIPKASQVPQAAPEVAPEPQTPNEPTP